MLFDVRHKSIDRIPAIKGDRQPHQHMIKNLDAAQIHDQCDVSPHCGQIEESHDHKDI